MRLSLIGSQIERDSDDQHDKRVRQPWPEIRARGDIEIGGRRASSGALEDEQRHAAPNESSGQCRDNVGNAGEGDDEAVQQSLAGSSDQDEDGERERLAESGVLHQARGEDVRHRDHRADRKVDAAADDDDRLRRGGKRERKSAERQRLNLKRTKIRMDRDCRGHRRDEQERHAEKPAEARQRPQGKTAASKRGVSHASAAALSAPVRPCAALKRRASSASSAGISAEIFPANKTIARSQARRISGSSDVNRRTDKP